MARTHGWRGNPPTDDDEAVAQILAATRRCLARNRTRTTVTGVALELGVSRATVYRYFPSTDALLFASSIEAPGGFLDHLARHVAGIREPVEIVLEAIAFTIEQLPRERYLSVVLSAGREVSPSGASPETVKAFGRAILGEIGRGWATEIDETTLEELIEWTLAVLHMTMLEESGPRSRKGPELRRYLRKWLGPALREQLPSASTPERVASSPIADRRPV